MATICIILLQAYLHKQIFTQLTFPTTGWSINFVPTLIDWWVSSISGTLIVLPESIKSLLFSNTRCFSTTWDCGLTSWGVRISGTIPRLPNHTESPKLQTVTQCVLEPCCLQLSLSRNYITGDVKQAPPSLSAVIVSSNYLACNMLDMTACVNLSVGTFQGLLRTNPPKLNSRIVACLDPVSAALSIVGEVLHEHTYSNPYKHMQSMGQTEYENMALIWSGNVSRLCTIPACMSDWRLMQSQLTTDASWFGNSASRSLEKDKIKQGSTSLFSGMFASVGNV